MPDSIRIDRDVTMEVRDGTKLRADIYRRNDRQKHPAIFIRTPYNKRGAAGSGGYLDVLSAVYTGFVVIVPWRQNWAQPVIPLRERLPLVEKPLPFLCRRLGNGVISVSPLRTCAGPDRGHSRHCWLSACCLNDEAVRS